MNAQQKIAVTGATGRLGRHLVGTGPSPDKDAAMQPAPHAESGTWAASPRVLQSTQLVAARSVAEALADLATIVCVVGMDARFPRFLTGYGIATGYVTVEICSGGCANGC